MPVFVFPAGADPAVGGKVGGGETVEAGDDMGSEENMLKPRLGAIRINTAQTLIEPGPDFPEHDVVEGRVASRMDGPVLVQGSGAEFLIHQPQDGSVSRVASR